MTTETYGTVRVQRVAALRPWRFFVNVGNVELVSRLFRFEYERTSAMLAATLRAAERDVPANLPRLRVLPFFLALASLAFFAGLFPKRLKRHTHQS